MKPEACNFIKKETLAQVFSCELAKFLITPFLTEQLWWLLLDLVLVKQNCPKRHETSLTKFSNYKQVFYSKTYFHVITRFPSS